jgi:hypothetical protein
MQKQNSKTLSFVARFIFLPCLVVTLTSIEALPGLYGAPRIV